jgi:hypothetical protein
MLLVYVAAGRLSARIACFDVSRRMNTAVANVHVLPYEFCSTETCSGLREPSIAWALGQDLEEQHIISGGLLCMCLLPGPFLSTRGFLMVSHLQNDLLLVDLEVVCEFCKVNTSPSGYSI